MNAERARWLSAGVAVLLFAALTLAVGSNPANLPDSWIERWLVKKLPLGSSIVAVRTAIDEENWKTIDEAVSDTGSVVIVEIGRATFLRNYVYVHFSFDRFGRLGQVRVEKQAAPREPFPNDVAPID